MAPKRILAVVSYTGDAALHGQRITSAAVVESSSNHSEWPSIPAGQIGHFGAIVALAC